MDHNDNSRLSMDTSYPKSKLGRFMIIGGLLGAGVSLFDRGTRKQVGRALNSVKDGGTSVLANMRQDPSQVTDQLSNYLQNTANGLRTAVQDVTDDMREMAQKVTGMTQSGKQAYQYAIEAGEEITEIASKLRHPASSFNAANSGNYLTDGGTTTYMAELGDDTSTFLTSGTQGSGTSGTQGSGTYNYTEPASSAAESIYAGSDTSSNSSSFSNMTSASNQTTSTSACSAKTEQEKEEDLMIKTAVDLMDENL